jgi:hypothetical protein
MINVGGRRNVRKGREDEREEKRWEGRKVKKGRKR